MRCIDRASLSRQLRKEDFTLGPQQSFEAAQIVTTNAALDVIKSNFAGLTFEHIEIRRKPAFRVPSLPHNAVLRCLNHAIRSSTKVRPSDRDVIIRQLATILREGVPHRLYKFDIKSFFESIDTIALLKDIAHDREIAATTSQTLSDYFQELKCLGIGGIPRGVPLSAALAEYSMYQFDAKITSLPDVYFYARYVDDIVIVTGAREQSTSFARNVANCLPFSLRFNTTKTKLIDIPIQRAAAPAVLDQFDYLGYNFIIYEAQKDRPIARRVDLSIAETKLVRLKTRLSCSFISYMRTRDFHTLCRRIQLLTGNYNIRDTSTGVRRNAGLYCNYRRANNVERLGELDAYLRALVIGKRSRLSKRLAPTLTDAQRKALLKFSFSKGFRERIFYNFRPSEIQILSRCWQHA